MKKIKITEIQAKLLGLKNIIENDAESGLKSVGTSIGEVVIRAVISGDNVPRLKDRIIQIVKRHDKDANINFFELTNKIVGQIKEIKLSAIKRDLKDLDPTIVIENKPLTKNLVKINKEQYDRLIKSGLIKENSNIDDTFKKEFAGKNIQNLKPVSEDNFNISKPNTSIPKLPKNTGDNELPMHENGENDNLKKETLELLKFLYHKSEDLSPFWEENGLNYDEICKALVSKKLIVSKDGKYEVSKTSDNPEEAKQAIENELRAMIKPENKETVSEPEMETEASNLPAGAEFDSSAPWNKKDEYSEPKIPKQIILECIYNNIEFAILKGPDGALYVFNHYGIDKDDFIIYASLEKVNGEYSKDFELTPEVITYYVNDKLEKLDKGVGKDDFDDGVSLVKIDEPLKQELLALYSKDNKLINLPEFKNSVSEVEGKSSHDIAKEKISSSLPISNDKPKQEQSKIMAKLADLKAKEQERRAKESSLPIGENNSNDSSHEKELATKMFDILSKRHLKPSSNENNLSNIILRKMSKDGLLDSGNNENGMVVWLNKKGLETIKSPEDIMNNYIINVLEPNVSEMTSASSSGAFTGPLGGADIVKREMPNTPVVGETTVAGAGNFQYDTPGLANVGRNGEFKKGPKTKAQSKTQYAGGSFVETSSCTKLNNNKEAQNGKCSQGAVDGVVKQKKTNGSIISPSLGENHIYEEISKKTGLTIDTVKNIINSKKNNKV